MRSFRFSYLLSITAVFISSVLVMGCAEPGPVEVTEISNPRVKIDYAATPDLVVKWYPETFSLYLGGDSIITGDVKEVDKFISNRISKIDKQKMVFIGQPDTSYQQFKDFRQVLVKHGIMKFRLLNMHQVY